MLTFFKLLDMVSWFYLRVEIIGVRIIVVIQQYKLLDNNNARQF